MTTAIIIDPAIKSYAGHHLTAAKGWIDAAQANGMGVQVLAHQDCIAEAVGAAPIEKVFTGAFYHVAPSDQKEAWKRLRFLQREFRNALAKPLMQVQRRDIVVLAHSTLVTLNGLAAWASGMPQERLPRLVAWLMMRPEDEDFVVPFGSTDCVVAAIDRLRTLFGDRLTLTGSTMEVCRRWEALNCGTVHFLPFTALRPALIARKDHIISSPPSILSIGHLGARKGLDLLPALIKEVDRRGVQARWTIGGASFEPGDSPALAEISSLAESQSNISFVTQPEGLQEYDDLLASADLVILPYSPEAYEERGSGVAEEAELLGLPYVAPKVEFSAASVSAGAAVCFEDWTADGIASALIEAASKLPELSLAAEGHALSAQKKLTEIREKILLPMFRDADSQAPLAGAFSDQLVGVDIIVTLHNYRRFLQQCLESINRQSYPNWRCIVVDDGSTDLTFQELRDMVGSFGDRFTYERHGTGGGQLKAIATGLSLGSNPFVLMLDADDCLTDDALDVHLSWHLNSRVPASFTSGRVKIIDELDRQLTGCLDNILWLDYADATTELPRADAHQRPALQFEPPPASFIKQDHSTIGRWFWSPTSALMFRRSVLELLLPDSIEIGRYGGDTYFAYASHAIGGSILIDKQVALYRRHGSNGYADMGVYGAGTMATRFSSSNWAEVAKILNAHVQDNLSQFRHQIRQDHIERLLSVTAPPSLASIASKSPNLLPMKKGKKQKTKLRYKVRREGKRIAAQLRQTLGRLASVPATPLQTADDQGSR